MPEGRTLILVLGMHRSGTSVLTRVLNLLGADVGTNLLQAQPDINARGFWEHEKLIAINEALLGVLERNWYDFRSLPEHWWTGGRFAGLRSQAVTFLKTAFADDAPLAAVKDPRLCLLLPFWKEAAHQAGWRPVAILASRAPWEVSASLCRRDPLSTTSANLLWLRYTRDSEKTSRDLPRSCVDYAALLDDWATVLSRTGSSLGVIWPQSLASAAAAVAAEIDPGLRHQRAHPDEMAGGIARQTTRAYHLLQMEKLNEAALDEVWQDFDKLLEKCPVLAHDLEETTRQIFAINNDLQILGKEHGLALEVVAEKDQQLGELAAELEHAASVVDERETQLRSLFEDLEYTRSIVEERDDQLQQITTELNALRSHPAVKLVRKLFFLDRK